MNSSEKGCSRSLKSPLLTHITEEMDNVFSHVEGSGAREPPLTWSLIYGPFNFIYEYSAPFNIKNAVLELFFFLRVHLFAIS